MKKKFKALMLLTALATGLSISVVGVLPVAAALVPSSDGAWYSTEGGPNFFDKRINYSGFRGIAQEFSIANKIDTLTVFSAGKKVPAKYVNFQYDDKSGNWYPFVAKKSSNPNSGLNLGETGYFWHQHNFLEFEDGAQNDTNFGSLVPIPGTALLLASGLLGLLLLRQKRSNKRHHL